MGRVQHEVEEASRMLRQRPCRCLRKTAASTLLPSSKFFLFSFFLIFSHFFEKQKRKTETKTSTATAQADRSRIPSCSLPLSLLSLLIACADTQPLDV